MIYYGPPTETFLFRLHLMDAKLTQAYRRKTPQSVPEYFL